MKRQTLVNVEYYNYYYNSSLTKEDNTYSNIVKEVTKYNKATIAAKGKVSKYRLEANIAKELNSLYKKVL